MSIELIKSIELVPKRNAFKARSYNNAGLKKWVDFGSVREHFNYSERLRLRRFISFLTELMTNCDVFSSSFLASSISAITSCGKRISTRFDLLLCLPVAIFYKMAIIITANIAFFINYFPNLILQAVLTQPEKDSLSFFACCWINLSKSSSKRIVCLVLFKRSFLLFIFFSCTGAVHYDRLYFTGAVHYNDEHYKKQSLKVPPTLSRDLTTITLTEVMIMANRYDSAHLRARQSKLYKFYDLSTAQVIQTTATTERQARKILGKQSLIFIARIRITPIIERARTWGGYSHE